MPRFALLEHTAAPDDPAGRHYDLLLEAGGSCRTWRLAEIPVADGPPVAAVELPPHRLAWLDHVAGAVSGGRGFARRVDGGACRPLPADAAAGLRLALEGGILRGRLAVDAVGAGWQVRLSTADV